MIHINHKDKKIYLEGVVEVGELFDYIKNLDVKTYQITTLQKSQTKPYIRPNAEFPHHISINC